MNKINLCIFALIFFSANNVQAGIKGKELKIFCQAAIDLESKRPISDGDIVKSPFCFGYIMGVESGFSLASVAVQQNIGNTKNNTVTKILKTPWMNKGVNKDVLAKKVVKLIDENPKYLTYPAAIIVVRALKAY